MPRYFTTPFELARVLGLNESTVLKWCENGMVQAWKDQDKWIIEMPCSIEDIRRFEETTKTITEKYGGEIDDFER